MRSNVSIAGHPIHPMVVLVPIALIIWTFVADVVYLASGRDHVWYSMSLWTGVAAIIAALVAGLPGLVDYLNIASKTDARPLGLGHMALNTTITALFVVALILQLDDSAVSGGQLWSVVVLHGVGNGLLLVSGWLGGEMVYRHHVAVVADGADEDRQEWRRHGRAAGTSRR